MHTGTNSDLSMSEAAAVLGIGRNTLFKQLRDLGVLRNNNLARSDLIQAGLFRIEFRQFTKPDDRFAIRQHYGVTLVTEKGLNYLYELIDREEKRNDGDCKSGISSRRSGSH